MAKGKSGLPAPRVPGLTEEEIEAVLLGLAMVQERGHEVFAEAAESAQEKLAALLPPPPFEAADTRATPRAAIERAIRTETRLELGYGDRKGQVTKRVVWPLDIGDADFGETMIAWCETRRDFRHFRLDRVRDATGIEERYPARRRILLLAWQARGEDDG